MARNIVYSDNPEAFKEITYGLWLNPIPREIGILFQVPPGRRSENVTHIPLIEEHDIGLHSKVIIWDPLSKSDTHYHPSVHCFFTPIHNGLSQSILNEDPVRESAKWATRPINTGQFLYIHDSIGAHQIINTSTTRSIASYHLYIREDSLTSDRA